MEPILPLIQQREEALLEIQMPKTDQSKTQGKKTDAKEEQRRRRLKTSLPRLEKKLFTVLIEFREVNGFDLEWDGEPYLGSLSNIILSDIELKAIRGKARKKSLQPKQVQGGTVPPPCAVRRLSENMKMSFNMH
jgi:hypothetical protein